MSASGSNLASDSVHRLPPPPVSSRHYYQTAQVWQFWLSSYAALPFGCVPWSESGCQATSFEHHAVACNHHSGHHYNCNFAWQAYAPACAHSGDHQVPVSCRTSSGRTCTRRPCAPPSLVARQKG